LKEKVDKSWILQEHWWWKRIFHKSRVVVVIVVYIVNQVQVKRGINKTPFELWYGYAPNINYFKVFRKCYILKDARKGKVDAKSNEGICLGYYTKRKAHKYFNSNTNKIVESTNVSVE